MWSAQSRKSNLASPQPTVGQPSLHLPLRACDARDGSQTASDPALQHLRRPLLTQLSGASEVTGNILSFVGMGPPLSGLELETVSLLDRKLKISNRAMDKATVKMTDEDPFHVEFNRRQQRSPWNRCTDAQEWLKSNPDFQQTFEGSGGASQGNTKQMAHWEEIRQW